MRRCGGQFRHFGTLDGLVGICFSNVATYFVINLRREKDVLDSIFATLAYIDLWKDPWFISNIKTIRLANYENTTNKNRIILSISLNPYCGVSS